MIKEYRIGATGTMPACEVADIHVRVWDLLEAGEFESATALHRRMLPVLEYETAYMYTWWKAVLVRRGVIASAITRAPDARALDAEGERALDSMLANLADDFVIPLP